MKYELTESVCYDCRHSCNSHGWRILLAWGLRGPSKDAVNLLYLSPVNLLLESGRQTARHSWPSLRPVCSAPHPVGSALPQDHHSSSLPLMSSRSFLESPISFCLLCPKVLRALGRVGATSGSLIAPVGHSNSFHSNILLWTSGTVAVAVSAARKLH